ncbi:MAG: hypothetical protein RMJ31_03200 [Nitrososphaerota archaeon]|nr:hypothetical protein [Nitrososphaerales archaeon]MDW8044764.1 hypothetical protein [Nitrososphaerota archaeon]
MNRLVFFISSKVLEDYVKDDYRVNGYIDHDRNLNLNFNKRIYRCKGKSISIEVMRKVRIT